MVQLIEYMNTFANYGTLACLIWLVYELRDIRRRDTQSGLAKTLSESIDRLSQHYQIEDKLKETEDSPGP